MYAIRSYYGARMEGVMEEIIAKYPDKVKVVFVNVLKPESQLLMKYYGIAAIPTVITSYSIHYTKLYEFRMQLRRQRN